MSKKILAIVSVALLVAACAQKPVEAPMADPVTVDMPDPNGKL